MAEETPVYDLMLLLSTTVEEERRAKVLGEVEKSISSSGGSIVHNGDWGARPLAYRINHQTDAEYHLLQFSGPTTLLESLNHSLGITDGVLRFRIIKVLPGTPAPPKPEPVVVHAAPPPPAAPAAESVEAAEAPEPAEPPADAVPEPAAPAAAEEPAAEEPVAAEESVAADEPVVEPETAAESEPADE